MVLDGSCHFNIFSLDAKVCKDKNMYLTFSKILLKNYTVPYRFFVSPIHLGIAGEIIAPSTLLPQIFQQIFFSFNRSVTEYLES